MSPPCSCNDTFQISLVPPPKLALHLFSELTFVCISHLHFTDHLIILDLIILMDLVKPGNCETSHYTIFLLGPKYSLRLFVLKQQLSLRTIFMPIKTKQGLYNYRCVI
jgi:hypothetical protein